MSEQQTQELITVIFLLDAVLVFLVVGILYLRLKRKLRPKSSTIERPRKEEKPTVKYYHVIDDRDFSVIGNASSLDSRLPKGKHKILREVSEYEFRHWTSFG